MKLFTTLAALGLGAAFGAKTTELADKVADVKAQLPSVDLGVIAPTGESADMLAQLDEFVRSRWDASSAKPEAFFGSVREFWWPTESMLIDAVRSDPDAWSQLIQVPPGSESLIARAERFI